MKGSDSGVPYAAYIAPSNPDSGTYGGMSFVIFRAEGHPCLIGLVIGTQGLAPDEAILGRPGHARKVRAICDWLNHEFGGGGQVAWAKQDPTRTDIPAPDNIQREWSEYDRLFGRYGHVVYGLYKPTGDRAGTGAALSAMLDLMFEERGHKPLKEFQQDYEAVRSRWFACLMPEFTRDGVLDLLKRRRFVILQGPPGTGKTRMARQILKSDYADFGRSVQFHPSTTYENFIGGLAPVQGREEGLGFRFAPKRGFLLEAAAAANVSDKPYLLHIDEINRADLSKILGEAIFLFEPSPESIRDIGLVYDFGEPFGDTFRLPENVHVLGTMNTADRSIAMVDLAVRRRFAFASLWPSMQVVEERGSPLSRRAFRELIAIFIEHASDEALALVPGHSYFIAEDDDTARVNLRTSLLPLLTEYLAQGYVGGFAEPMRGYIQWLDAQ